MGKHTKYHKQPCPRCGSVLLTDAEMVWCTDFLENGMPCRYGLDAKVPFESEHPKVDREAAHKVFKGLNREYDKLLGLTDVPAGDNAGAAARFAKLANAYINENTHTGCQPDSRYRAVLCNGFDKWCATREEAYAAILRAAGLGPEEGVKSDG